jgi:aspartokinase-like uncharacterized kinase
VKIGGSLALHPAKLRDLCAKLSELSNQHKIVVVPGGGEFTDVVRDMDKRLNLSCEASHRMAILGMDQYGFLLNDLLPGSLTENTLEGLLKTLNLGRLSVFLPSRFLLRKDALENSWDVTSDSIAVYIAGQLDIGKVVLVTDVDGVYSCDPKKYSNAKLFNRLSAKELLTMDKRTSVDQFLPKLLLQLSIECFVVNGLYPERVEAIFDKRKTICTLIQ